MASHGFGLRLAAFLLVLLVLGNECASAKRQIRKSKNQAEEPTEGSLVSWIRPPKDLKVEVYCDNVINATWEYNPGLEIQGFNATLCNVNQSKCETTHVDYKDRWLQNKLKAHDTRFNFSLYAYNHDERGEAAGESFTSFPKIPNVELLPIMATSPTELKVEWLNKWKHEIDLSACSKTAPCLNANVPAESMAHTFHDLEPGTTYDVTAQMTITMNNRTCTGEAAKKSGTTLELAPPTNLSVDVSCSNEAHVKWAYDDPKQITGFFVMLCHQSEPRCENKTLLKAQMECSFSLQKQNSSYNISVQSFYESTRTKNKTYSKKVTESISSFPKLPELGDISVSGVSETAVNVTWNTKWDGQIAFNICPSPEIPKDCQNYTVYGEAGEHTFEGLASNTTYRIRAQSQATVQNRTCQGHLHQFLASTTPKRPEKVQNVHYNVENGTILQISWELPEGSEASGFTIKCQDPKTKYTQSQDVSGEKRPYHAAVVLQELVASFSCSLFAFNLNTSGGHFGGPAYGFSVSTDGIAPPANLTLVARNSTSLTFSWSVDPNATKCEIIVAPEGGFGEEYEGSCEHDKRHNGTVIHTVTGLHPWTRYNVSVKNCREFCGQPEFLVNITDVAAPSEVLNFSYSIQKEVNVLLTWKKPHYPNGPLDGYLIKVRNDDQNETKTYDVPGDHTEKEMNLRDQFNLFNVSISAYNKAETSNETFYGPESERQLETLGKGPLPPRPKAEEVKEDSAHLAWEEPHDPRYNITGFSVKVNDQPPKEINESSYTMEHLQPWTEYNVSVASCTNKTSCGQWRHLGFKTDFGAPSAPLDLKAPEAGTHWMLVQWEKPKTLNGPLSGYNVSFIHGSSLLNAVTKELSYNCTELVPGTMYDVSVFAFNEINSVTKRGPPTTLQATTQADIPSGKGASATVIALAVVIPLILIILVASYFVYKKYFQTRTGERTPLRTAEGM